MGATYERRAPAARVVALARPLDLDHLGAEIGKELGGPRASEDTAKIENANSGQANGHGRPEQHGLLAMTVREKRDYIKLLLIPSIIAN